MTEKELKETLAYWIEAHRNLKRRVYVNEVNEQLRSAGKTARLPIEFRSQFGEDLLLWDLFRGQSDGFFIEVGAFDGVDLSVSFIFEAIGWKGLLVEALPEAAQRCAANRPDSRVVQAALGAKGSKGTTTFTRIQGPVGEQFSFLVAEAEHRRRIGVHGGVEVPIEVPLMTMDDALGDYSGPIDFASIDVEGGELDLLKGFDLRRYKPRVLMVEENYPTAASPIGAYLTEMGYMQTGRLTPTNIYARVEDAEMVKRCRALKA